MAKEYIMAIDAGTTSSRTILFDSKGDVVAVAQEEFRQIYPQKGWVEHDPIEIADTQVRTMKRVVEKADIQPSDIVAIGITNQRETIVAWNAETGLPVYNAIVWQCRRTADKCQAMRNEGMAASVLEKTGLVIDPYFSATKIAWLFENHPSIKEMADKGKLKVGTIDSWLLYVLSGRKEHRTDPSNASRTMLFNINTLTWDHDLLTYFSIPGSILPEVSDSCCKFGELDKSILGVEIPVYAILGDQQAALFGQNCFNEGEAKVTYGTGSFILVNIGGKPKLSRNNLLTTVGWVIDGKPTYATEGSVFIAGAAIQWLRDNMGLVDNSAETEHYAFDVEDSHGLIFVPAFAGLGAPYWRPDIKGFIYGITRDTDKRHIVRACLEGIAYSIRDVLDGIVGDTGKPLTWVKADGGASANNFLLQFQSDVLNIPIVRPKIIETTALGVAFMAGLGAGVFESQAEVRKYYVSEKEFTPAQFQSQSKDGYRQWQALISRLLS